MDLIATYIIVITLAIYKMVFEVSDRVFLFWFLLACIVAPLWVRVCTKMGKGDEDGIS